MKHFFALGLLLVFPFIDGKLILNSKSILLRPGSSFMQYFKKDGVKNFSECSLKFTMGSQTYNTTIPMHIMQEVSGTPFEGRLMSLGRNYCGFKIINFTGEDPPDFTLSARYTDMKNLRQTYAGAFRVTVYDYALLRNTVNNVVLGGTATVSCGISNVQISCTMFDPKGNMVLRGEKKCIHQIDHVTMDHIGNWTCVPTLTQSMEPLKEVQELKVVEETSVETWYKEEGAFGIIGCKYNIYTQTIKSHYCQFVSPHKDIYTITQSVGATKRYTTLGTDFDNNICQIEFKLPVDESEKGNWKCIIEDKSGGFIYVDPFGSHPSFDDRYSYPRQQDVFVKLGSRLTIFCQVPYSSSNCYIKSPTGETILGGNKDTFRLGECRTEVAKSNKSHVGTWNCYFSRPDEAVDDVIEIDVKEHYTMKALYKEVEASSGQGIELLCRATTPIQSCQFVDPNGNSYSVDPKKKADSIRYYGRGFDYGDCGLRIDSVVADDAGLWSCVINYMGNSQSSLKDVMGVTVDGIAGNRRTAVASAVGVLIGIILIVVAVGIFIQYVRYKRRDQRNTRQERQERQEHIQAVANVQEEEIELREV